MSPRGASAPERVDSERRTPSLSAGYLAALPLFAAYELGLWALPDVAARASAERLVARALFLFGGRVQLARVALLAAAAALAYARMLRLRRAAAAELAPPLGQSALEGVLAGVLLGPLLLLSQRWLGAELPGLAAQPQRSLAAALRLIGAAPWEELLFRVGAYGGLYLGVRRACAFLGLATPAARGAAELGALLGSAVLFAAFHLDGVQALLGTSGEPYGHALFLWRVSAGILLGALFRWRGFGAAAWAHAVFNLGIALGIGA
jgi:hypothetical protein